MVKTHSLIIGSGQNLKNIQQAMAVKLSLVIGRKTIAMIKGNDTFVYMLINI